MRSDGLKFASIKQNIIQSDFFLLWEVSEATSISILTIFNNFSNKKYFVMRTYGLDLASV